MKGPSRSKFTAPGTWPAAKTLRARRSTTHSPRVIRSRSTAGSAGAGIDNAVGQATGGPEAWLADPGAAQGMVQVDFHGVAAALAADQGTFLLDTRQILEWEAGHIAGAVLMPFYEVPDRLAEIPRDRPVHVYCGSGYRAAAVASLLQQQGFTNIVHVDDDFADAAAAGLTIVAGDAPEREPGWTWIASRAAVREYSPRSAADVRG